MTRSTTRFTLAATGLVAATALALTGCSGDIAATESGDTGESSASTWIEANAELNAELKDAGYTDPLVVATDLTIGYPWAAFKDDGTTPDGLDVDIMDALGQVLGAEIVLENTSFDSLIPGLAAERYDFSVSAMLDNKVRQEKVDFVDFIIDASGFIVSKDSDLTDLSVEDACGMTIGVVRGSVEEMYLTAQNDKCLAEGQPEVTLEIFQQLGEGVLAVSAGRVEALCGDKIQNAYLEALPDSDLREVGGPIGQAPVGIAVTKNSPLVGVLQNALQALIDDGAYASILEKWGVSNAAVESAVVNGAVN